MKLHYWLLIIALVPCIATSMKRKPDEPAEEPSKAIKVEKLAREETRAKIQNLKALAARGDLPEEMVVDILKQLADIEVIGATEEQKLYNSIANIRNVMEVYYQLYADKPLNGDLIGKLADRYMKGNVIKVAIALATTGAGQWLAEFVDNDDAKKEKAGAFLIDAVKLGELGQAKFILTYLPNIINERDFNGSTALLWAILNYDLSMIYYLMGIQGIDPNVKTFTGHTALMLAAQNGHLAIVEQLLQMPKIKVNIKTIKEATALMFAAHFGHLEIVKRLLQVPGIDMTAALPVARASDSPNKDVIVQLLIENGAI